jgi:hypothetical protein
MCCQSNHLICSGIAYVREDNIIWHVVFSGVFSDMPVILHPTSYPSNVSVSCCLAPCFLKCFLSEIFNRSILCNHYCQRFQQCSFCIAGQQLVMNTLKKLESACITAFIERLISTLPLLFLLLLSCSMSTHGYSLPLRAIDY